MLRQLFLAATTALALIGGSPAGANDLKRLTLRQDLLGWEAVGRLDLKGGAFCTASLIATDLVLTAAHCLFDHKTNERLPVSEIRFRAGLGDGEAIAESGVLQAVAHAQYHPTGTDDRTRIRYDVALLKLETPVPIRLADPFVVDNPVSQQTEVSIVSYARGRSSALSHEHRCGVLGRGNGLLAFDCDVYYGSSGAPVFDISEGHPRVVSIISGGARTEDGIVSFGMELPSVVSELKYAFRTGNGVWPKIASAGARRVQSSSERSAGGARFVKP